MVSIDGDKISRKRLVLPAQCWQKMSKTNLLNERVLAQFVEMAKTKKLSDNSWLIDVATVNQYTWELTVNNPNIVEETDKRTPQEIIAEIEQLDVQVTQALRAIKTLL